MNEYELALEAANQRIKMLEDQLSNMTKMIAVGIPAPQYILTTNQSAEAIKVMISAAVADAVRAEREAFEKQIKEMSTAAHNAVFVVCNSNDPSSAGEARNWIDQAEQVAISAIRARR